MGIGQEKKVKKNGILCVRVCVCIIGNESDVNLSHPNSKI